MFSNEPLRENEKQRRNVLISTGMPPYMSDPTSERTNLFDVSRQLVEAKKNVQGVNAARSR